MRVMMRPQVYQPELEPPDTTLFRIQHYLPFSPSFRPNPPRPRPQATRCFNHRHKSNLRGTALSDASVRPGHFSYCNRPEKDHWKEKRGCEQ